MADRCVTWGVLAVVFVQLHQHWRRHHQEVTQRHGDGVRHHRKTLTQTTQTLKTQTPTVRFWLQCMTVKGGGGASSASPTSPVSSRWGGACERWWLYWMSWTVASPTALCRGSQLLNKGAKRGIMQGWKQVTSCPSRRRLTLLFRHSPHHDVHAGSVGLAAQLQGAQFALEVLHVV